MGFWTFLYGEPPVRPDTEDETPAVAAEGEASEDTSEGQLESDASGDALAEAEQPSDAIEIDEDAEAEDAGNLFAEDIDTTESEKPAEAMVLADPEPEDAEDDDSRLLETLMAVGAEADEAAAEEEPEAVEPVDPVLELEPEIEPEVEPEERTPDIMDLSAGHKNDGVRATLAGMGDDGTAPRHVVHFAYSSEGSSPQDEVATVLGEQGFDVIDASEDGQIRMEHTREVASADFDAFTDLLEAELEAKGWEYDGWECAVVGTED